MPAAQRLILVFASLVLCLFVGIPALAQTETATLSGVIQDPKGAVVPEVEITATRIETGTIATTKTNGAGIYFFTGLVPGHYHLMVRKPGFKEIAIKEFELNVQDKLEQNFSLEIGSVSESVTVNSDDAHINTTDATVSTVIDRHFVEALPLNGRSFNTLLQLTPGVVIAPTTANPSNPGQFNINGQRSDSNYFVVDGVGANFGTGSATPGALPGNAGSGGTQAFNAYGGTSSLASVDAVQEFRVQTSSFAPEFGRAPGGQVTIQTRSGTNGLHGSLFDYFRNDALDANDWFFNQAVAQTTPGTAISKPALRQNDFGGTVGGPVIPNKTFFFFSYEGLRVRQPETSSILVPSLDLRASAVPAAAPFLDAFPVPNGAISPGDPTTALFTGTFSNQITTNATSVRVDHVLKENFRIFGRYNYAPSMILFRRVDNNLAQVTSQHVYTQTLTGGADLLLNSKLQLSFRGNYSEQSGYARNTLDSFGGARVPNVSILLPPPLTAQTGFVDFFNVSLPPSTYGSAQNNKDRQVNFVGSLTYVRGVHGIKVGGDFRNLYLDTGWGDAQLFDISFSLQQFASTGTASLVVNNVRHPGKILYRTSSLYGQDTWRIGRRLTATYGARWEVVPPPHGRDGTNLASWANTENLAALTLAPQGTPLWRTRYDNFAPRAGLAYQITPGGDFVVRAGGGMFYDSGSGSSASLGSSFPLEATFIGFNERLPIATLASVTPTFSLAPPFGLVRGFSSNLKLPVSYQWNVALEKAFSYGQAITATYVGQRGRHLYHIDALAQPNPNFANVILLTNSRDTSDFNSLQVQYRKSLSKGLQALANYAWSHSMDTNSTDAVQQLPGQLYSIRGERGSSDFDVRHSFSGAIVWNLPTLAKQRFLSVATRGWSLNTVIQARTGFPIDIITGSVPLPGFQGGTRVDQVPGVPVWLYGSQYPGGRALNASAFALPPTPRQGNLRRNAFRGFGLTQADLSLGRRFSFGEKLALQFQADMFNVFNHPNFANPDSNFDDGPLFGLSSQMFNQSLGGLNALYQVGGPRSVQLSLKLAF
jgi:hypothetical protein